MSHLTPRSGCLKGSLDPGQKLPLQGPGSQAWAVATVVACLPAPSKTQGGWVCPEGKREQKRVALKGVSATTGKVQADLETHSKNDTLICEVFHIFERQISYDITYVESKKKWYK